MILYHQVYKKLMHVIHIWLYTSDFDQKVSPLLHKFNNRPWSTTTTPLQFMQSGNSPNLRRKILKASKRICKKPEPIAVLIHAISNGCGKLAGKSVLSPPCNLLVPQQLRREECTQYNGSRKVCEVCVWEKKHRLQISFGRKSRTRPGQPKNPKSRSAEKDDCPPLDPPVGELPGYDLSLAMHLNKPILEEALRNMGKDRYREP